MLRAAGRASGPTPFAVAQHLAAQLLGALPDVAPAALDESARALLLEKRPEGEPPRLRPFADPALDREQLQNALSNWLARVCEKHALMIAVDDVQRIDEHSLALLAALAMRAASLHLILVATLERDAAELAPPAFQVLERHCTLTQLEALSRRQSEQLLGSVFGRVPRLTLLADRLYDVAVGNPRETLALARHLLEAGQIQYERGHWSLPDELSSSALPDSAAAAFVARVSALPPLARRLAKMQALLGARALRREDYAALAPSAGARELDAALAALIASETLQRERELYWISHSSLTAALSASLDRDEARELHGALYDYVRQQPDAHLYAIVKYLFGAERPAEALDMLAATSGESSDEQIDRVLRTGSAPDSRAGVARGHGARDPDRVPARERDQSARARRTRARAAE